MDMISIVVPMYNAKNSIKRCVDSIINQTYSNIEIIVVDDGSNDGSYNICRKEFQENKNVHLYHKENGGVSSARNYGITKCHGQYIAFVDPDDYIEKDMYQKLYNSIQKNKSDIAMCGYIRCTKRYKDYSLFSYTKDTISGLELLKDIYNYRTMGVLWNKLFCAKKIKLLFDNEVHFCEDVLFLTQICIKEVTISVVNEGLYYYEMNEESLSSGKFNERKFTIIKSLEQIGKIVEKSSVCKDACFFISSTLVYVYTNLFYSVEMHNLDQKKNLVKTYLQKFLKTKKLDHKSKLKIYCALWTPRIFFKLKTFKTHIVSKKSTLEGR